MRDLDLARNASNLIFDELKNLVEDWLKDVLEIVPTKLVVAQMR